MDLPNLETTPSRPQPLEIPSRSYYQRWRLCDKLFDGKFSGSSTPMSPATPLMNRLQKSLIDLRNFTTPVVPRANRLIFKELESPICPTSSLKVPSRYEDDFIQLGILGAGEFGKVFHCVHRIDGIQYAVKKINTHNPKKTSYNAAIQEAYVLAKSSILEDNAYIVRYHSVWVESDALFISMELCECSLAKYIKEHEINEGFLRKLLRDVCKALKKIHSHNIVHMDIKAENILFSASKKFKLGDLGLGRVTTNLSDISEGDTRYLAKEVLMQALDDPESIPDLTKADIFSLGATCYEIMRNSPLPKNGPEWHKIRNNELEVFHEFSNQINECIRSMMNSDPEKRPSAKDLLESVLLSENQVQVKRLRKYAGSLEQEVKTLKEKLGYKKRKMSM